MASKIIAVAGGSGKLGRAIVEELVAHGGYKVFVLGREASDAKSKELGAQTLAVDYSNQSSLVSVLESNNIDTVISVLSSQAGADPELALIKAADASKVTKRYVANTWGIRYTPEVAAIFPMSQAKLTALETLKATGLEYTAVINGFFLDYFGFPHVKSYLGPFPVGLDIANNIAAIPASGDVPIVFTYSFDIGRFIGKLVGESKWPEESIIIGDKLSWNEFLAIAEEAKGTKFDVKHDSMEMLQQGKVTELPSQVSLYSFLPKEMLQDFITTLEVLMEKGVFNFERTGSLNERYADVKTKSAKELVTEAWKGK